MACGGADAGTGPILLCFVVDLFHLGIWGNSMTLLGSDDAVVSEEERQDHG